MIILRRSMIYALQQPPLLYFTARRRTPSIHNLLFSEFTFRQFSKRILMMPLFLFSRTSAVLDNGFTPSFSEIDYCPRLP